MEIRVIADDYAVSPQIAPEDVPGIVAAGYTTVICNRPDEEVPVELQSGALRAAVEAAGLSFVLHPITHPTINAETVGRQMEIVAASDGPVFAYCASGTRCSILWSLGQVGRMSADDIRAATAKAGYNLSALRPRLGG